MSLLAISAALMLSADDLPPPPPPPVVLVPVYSGVDREVTIRALRDEIDDLETRKRGYFAPVFWAGVGSAVLACGLLAPVSGDEAGTFRASMILAGTLAAGAAVTWLIVRIAHNASLAAEIDGKSDQIRALEARRLER
jgi:hypothetical protein